MKEELTGDVPRSPTRDPRQLEPALEHIRQALIGLQYGEVSVIVQDGVVVQVERIERKRLRRGQH